MYLRSALVLGLILAFFGAGWASDCVLTQRDTLYFCQPTTIDGRLAPDWDTVLVEVTKHDGQLVASMGLASDGKGRWRGSITDLSSYRGSYCVEYYGIYDDAEPSTNDTFPVFLSLTVLDTMAFQGAAASVDSGMVARAVHFASTSVYGDSAGTMGKMYSDIQGIKIFFGACDSCYYYLYPIGWGNKDSLVIFFPDGTRAGKVIYKYGANSSVVDTALFYKSPWW